MRINQVGYITGEPKRAILMEILKDLVYEAFAKARIGRVRPFVKQPTVSFCNVMAGPMMRDRLRSGK